MPDARVTEIIDGDAAVISPKWTLDRYSGSVIQYEGVKAPDRGQEGFEKAKSANEALVLLKNVSYEGKRLDPWRRLVVQITVDGQSVNKALREKGYK